jgi:AraC-like DNA-binding protein
MLLDLSIYAPTYLSLTWAFILLFSSKTNRARFFLGIFMFVVAMVFMSHVVYYHHLNNIYIYFDLIFIFGSLSIFPIYYWYIKLLTFRSKIDFKDLKHLIPAVTILVATIITYLLMSKEMRDLYISKYLYGTGNWNDATPLIKTQLILCYTLQIVYFTQIIFTFLRVRVFIADYNDNIANFYSNLDNKTLRWPQIILYSFVATSTFTIFTNFMGRSFFDKYPFILLFTCIAYSAFLFVLGYLGYLQNHTIVTFEQDNNILVDSEKKIEIEPENVIENKNKDAMLAQLKYLFETEQIYKEKDLKISDIATKLNTNRTYISTFINNEFSISFNTFVNQYRVEEAKKLLLNESNNFNTLDNISNHVGFGSLNSFIRVFKEITGTTPGNFRKDETKTINFTSKTGRHYPY